MTQGVTTNSVVVQQPQVVRTIPTESYVTRAPVVTERVVVQAPVIRREEKKVASAPLNTSTVKFDDESRYKTHAGELHGYGRGNTKARFGSTNRVFKNRVNKDVRDAIVSSKSTASEYRNDNNCNLM